MVSSSSEWTHTLPEYTGTNRTDYAVGGENRIHSEAVLTFSVSPGDSITKVYVYAQVATLDPVDGTYYWNDIAVDYNFIYPSSTTVTLGFVDIWPITSYEPGAKHVVYWGVKVNGDSDDYTYTESDYYLLSQTAEPTATPTATIAPTSTFTPAPTPTGVWTPTATRTFTNTPTVPTPTPTGTATSTYTPTNTPVPATPTAADAILADSTGDFIIFPWTHTTSQGRHRAYWYEWFYTFGGLPITTDFSSNALISTATQVYRNDPVLGQWEPWGGYRTFIDSESWYSTDTVDAAYAQIANLHKKTIEPTGFVNRTDSTISFDDAYFRFYITGAHEILIKGTSYMMPAANIQITNSTGLHYIYYDLNATIQTSTIFPGMAVPLIAFVYWNSTTGHGMLSDERHGVTMDWSTHEWLHENIGSVYESGMTGTFNPTTFQITAGELDDEDNEFDLPLATTCSIMYLNGSTSWVWDTTQTVYYKKVLTNLQYNNGTTLTPATNTSRFIAYWIYATNSPMHPYVSITGQREDSTLADAEVNNKPELLTFGQIPSVEMKLLYRVILKNTSTPTVSKVDDYRTSKLGPSSSYNATKHSVLTDLGWELSGHNDQYFNVIGGVASAATFNATAAVIVDATITGSLVIVGTPTPTPTLVPTYAYTPPTPQNTYAYTPPTVVPTQAVYGGGIVTVIPTTGGWQILAAAPTPQNTYAYTPPTPQNTYAYTPPTPQPAATPYAFIASGVAEVTNSLGQVTIYAPDTILEGSGAVQITESPDHHYVIAVPSLGGRYVTSNIGNGVAKVWTVTHGLGFQHVVVQLNDNNTLQIASAETVLATTDTVTLYFPTAPTTNQYTVLCMAGGYGSDGGTSSGNHDDLLNRNTTVAHVQYALKAGVEAITGDWTFNRAGAPFIIGANAHDQLVDGLNADMLDGLHYPTEMQTPTPANTPTPQSTFAYVPPTAADTPTPANTPTPQETFAHTFSTPVNTPTPADTVTPVNTPTAASTPSPANTCTPANTPTVIFSPTPQFADKGILLGDGINTVFNWYPSGISRWPLVAVRETNSPYHLVSCEIVVPAQDQITFYFATPPEPGQYKAYVLNADYTAAWAATIDHNLNGPVAYAVYLSTGQLAETYCTFTSDNQLTFEDVVSDATVSVALLSNTTYLGDGINFDLTFTHNLNSRDLVFNSFYSLNGIEVIGEIMFSTKDTGRSVFNYVPSLRQYTMNYSALHMLDDEQAIIPTPANTPTPASTPTPWSVIAGDGITVVTTETLITVAAWTPTPTGTPTPTYTATITPTPTEIFTPYALDDLADVMLDVLYPGDFLVYSADLGVWTNQTVSSPTPVKIHGNGGIHAVIVGSTWEFYITPSITPTPTVTSTFTHIPTNTQTPTSTRTSTSTPTATPTQQFHGGGIATVVQTPGHITINVVAATPQPTYAYVPPTPVNTYSYTPPTPANTVTPANTATPQNTYSHMEPSPANTVTPAKTPTPINTFAYTPPTPASTATPLGGWPTYATPSPMNTATPAKTPTPQNTYAYVPPTPQPTYAYIPPTPMNTYSYTAPTPQNTYAYTPPTIAPSATPANTVTPAKTPTPQNTYAYVPPTPVNTYAHSETTPLPIPTAITFHGSGVATVVQTPGHVTVSVVAATPQPTRVITASGLAVITPALDAFGQPYGPINIYGMAPSPTPTPASNYWHLYDGVSSNLYALWNQYDVLWTSSYSNTRFNLVNMSLKFGSDTLGTKIDLWGDGLYSLGISSQTLDVTTDKRVSFSAPGAIKSVTIDVEHGGVEANYFTFGRTYTAFEGLSLPNGTLFLLTSMEEIVLKDPNGTEYTAPLWTGEQAIAMAAADEKFYFIPIKGTSRYVAFYQRY